MRRSHLLVISERVALGWVLREQRMAFPAGRANEVTALRQGDELLLYTTRGCWHNPGRDRGRVVGSATVLTAVRSLKAPVVLSGREFPIGCAIELHSLAPVKEGVDLADLIPQLTSFPNKTGWATRLRRPFLTLTTEDAGLLKARLQEVAEAPQTVLDDYLAAATPVARR
jgi:hypothetical protein